MHTQRRKGKSPIRRDTIFVEPSALIALTEAEKEIAENLANLEDVILSDRCPAQKTDAIAFYLSEAKSQVQTLDRLFRVFVAVSEPTPLTIVQTAESSEEACYRCLRSYASLRSHPQVVEFLDLMICQCAPEPILSGG